MTRTTIKERIHIAESRLELYINAEAAILSGQSYEVEGLKLTRANLKDVQAMIAKLQAELSALEAKLNNRARFRIMRPGW